MSFAIIHNWMCVINGNLPDSWRASCCYYNYCSSGGAGGHLHHHRGFDHWQEARYKEVSGEIKFAGVQNCTVHAQ